MADQTVRIDSMPNDGKERVALDLFNICATRESWAGLEDRFGVLKLYAQCWRVVHGSDAPIS